jgi:hypothetical protein
MPPPRGDHFFFDLTEFAAAVHGLSLGIYPGVPAGKQEIPLFPQIRTAVDVTAKLDIRVPAHSFGARSFGLTHFSITMFPKIDWAKKLGWRVRGTVGHYVDGHKTAREYHLQR